MPRRKKPQQVCYFWFGNSMITLHGVIEAMRGGLWRAQKAELGANNQKLETPRHAFGGATLAQHWQATQRDPKLLENMRLLPWVIIHEQSVIPSVPMYRPGSVAAARGLTHYCRQQRGGGPQIMFMMTWGRRGGFKGHGVQYGNFLTHNQAIYEGYLLYIHATSTPDRPTYLAPVGLVFETIYNDCLTQDPESREPGSYNSLFARLYGNDGYHQSKLGALAAGMTVATAITGFNPYKQNHNPGGLSQEDMNAVKDAVARTILQTFESGQLLYPWKTSWTGSTAPTSAVCRADKETSTCASPDTTVVQSIGT
ncbi:expressed unknown protein [Seminavis robusta]|uniref:Uncharacterized protein n=1 Tax=Seminavis robusta TaxID=568900 RepID=A0A9N8DK83_9STRA|nr:expressed unknown protein [Seminavis robusta]|eukprot:Sro129_g061480.1 n/a (311) ;mRNA; f:29111-30170